MYKSLLKRAAIASFMIAALVTQTLFGVSHAADKRLYYWSGYQHNLYTAYDKPRNVKGFEATLRRLIKKSEESGRKTAPGILAEYGYLHYERGDFDSAIYWFEREARDWPESAVLMRRVIALAHKGAGS